MRCYWHSLGRAMRRLLPARRGDARGGLRRGIGACGRPRSRARPGLRRASGRTPAAAAKKPAGRGSRPRGCSHRTTLRATPGGPRCRADRAADRVRLAARALAVTGRRGGWLRVHRDASGRNGSAAGSADRRVRLGATDISIHVDRSARRLMLKRGSAAVLRRMPIAVGRPGTETPTGPLRGHRPAADRRAPTRPTAAAPLALSGHQTKLRRPAGRAATGSRSTARRTSETVGKAASLGCMRARPADIRRADAAVPARRAGVHPRLGNACTSAPCGSNGTRRTVGPARRLAAQPRRRRPRWPRTAHHTSTVGPAPEIVAPSAPSSARALDQLHRPRVQRRRGAAGAGGPPSPRATRSRSPRREAEHEQRRVGDVEHRVAHRHLGGQRRARLGGAHRPRRARRAPPRARAAGRSASAGPSAQSTKPPSSAAATLSGWPSSRGRLGQQVGAELEDRVGGERARPRTRPRSCRGRPTAGCRSGSRTRSRRAARSAREAADGEVAAVARDRQVGATAKRPVSTTSSSMCRRQRGGQHVEARPEVGRGGRDADAPTRLTARTACSTASMSGSQGTTEPAWPSAVCGSFSPWPVSTQTTRSAPSAPCASSPATLAAEAGSQNTPSCGGEEAVGVEDLGVGDRARRRRARRSSPAIASSQRAGLPIRIALATVSGFVDRLAVHERRRALGLEAEHPRLLRPSR